MEHIRLLYLIIEMSLENKRPVTTGELQDTINIPRATLHRYLSDLIRDRLICRVKRGHYAVGAYWLTSSLIDVHRMYDQSPAEYWTGRK